MTVLFVVPSNFHMRIAICKTSITGENLGHLYFSPLSYQSHICANQSHICAKEQKKCGNEVVCESRIGHRVKLLEARETRLAHRQPLLALHSLSSLSSLSEKYKNKKSPPFLLRYLLFITRLFADQNETTGKYSPPEIEETMLLFWTKLRSCRSLINPPCHSLRAGRDLHVFVTTLNTATTSNDGSLHLLFVVVVVVRCLYQLCLGTVLTLSSAMTTICSR